VDSFWKKTKQGTEDACWQWQGCIDALGYGATYYKGQQIRAHRLAFLLANGYLPKEGVVRHLCANGRCVNPNHLAHGTKKDNAQDAIRHGAFIGVHKNAKRLEEHPHAVLTNEQVLAMRAMKKSGVSGADIARHFKANYSTTMAAISGQNYGSI